MTELSKMQKIILDDIEAYMHKEGKKPTFKQLAEKHGISIPTIAQHVDYIKRKGYYLFNNFCPFCGTSLNKRIKGSESETFKKISREK